MGCFEDALEFPCFADDFDDLKFDFDVPILGFENLGNFGRKFILVIITLLINYSLIVRL